LEVHASNPSHIWPLRKAKAELDQLFRRARLDGPQTVRIRGTAAVTITATWLPRLSKRKLTGADLFEALRSCPFGEELSDAIDQIEQEQRWWHERLSELIAKDDLEKRSRAERAREVCP
jgi:hypothetical protein